MLYAVSSNVYVHAVSFYKNFYLFQECPNFTFSVSLTGYVVAGVT